MHRWTLYETIYIHQPLFLLATCLSICRPTCDCL